ncbi:sugar phosphate isomerase/epimerase [Ruminococcus sp. CLA-AA-H200]|uniref:Sugar phosphate isomerase/epimerase n=1 Tax=Ruminococcus turbiniformis TaxID=2881258 RepID=A0ABS8FSW6_9FIRM|nr:sugar phosphate isomerase/epimerase [Ruminococcus turbiniformis]MCC2253058.1 sugar phosphate isomerase/epimerase [Ruminococcus turbiniformis]
MKTSFHEYMRVGIILHMAYNGLSTGEGPVLECLSNIAADDYFDAVEITQIKDDETRRKAAEMIEIAHMDVAYGGQPCLLTTGMNINDLDETKRRAAVDRMKAAIDEAYEIRAKGFSFLAGKYEEEKKEEAYELLLDSTRELCEYAKSKGGMPVLCEVFDYDIDKKSLIGPVALAKRYAETMCAEYDNFGLMVDCSHIPMLHETFEENLLPIKDYIRHAHMGNTVIKSPDLPAYGDQHPRFGFPNSENDVEELAAYLQVLLDIGFLNRENPPIVSFEVKPYGDEESAFVIANAKRTLNAAWKLVEEKK